MKKMISVINDNLRSVINGIKTHREETEKNLVVIKNEMDDKIAIATEYKRKIENARMIISDLENEISELENDLNELNTKFGSKDFKEILAAGNKEINTKIIEKRALISGESQNILEITEKAQELKKELALLKERKKHTEASLEKTIVLEGYYTKRIVSIVDYSEEHTEELENYVEEVPQEELLVNSADLENVDITGTVDGSVFEEIDEISSTSQIDETLIESALNAAEDNEELEGSHGEVLDLTMTQQLDDIILQANNLLEKSEQIKEKVDSHIVSEEEPEIKEEIVTEEVVDNIEEVESEAFEEEVPVEVKPKEDDGSLYISVDDSEANIPEGIAVTPSIDEPLDSSDLLLANPKLFLDDFEGEDENVLELEIDNDENDNEENKEDIEDNNEVDDFLKEFLIPEANDEDSNNVITENVFTSPDKSFADNLRECGLEEERFSEEDIIKLENNFNKNNTKDFLNVMIKHEIPVVTIYKSVDVLVNVTPQTLDQILTLLGNTHASTEAISYIFNTLDKVNINRLEESISVNKEAELTQILYEAMPYAGESDLMNRLVLNKEEENELRKNATVDDFKMMNMFPDVVMANYNALKALKINNLRECIIKHPHRFIFNPDRFAAILDKYDTEDLIRCINKNSAVIDRL